MYKTYDFNIGQLHQWNQFGGAAVSQSLGEILQQIVECPKLIKVLAKPDHTGCLSSSSKHQLLHYSSAYLELVGYIMHFFDVEQIVQHESNVELFNDNFFRAFESVWASDHLNGVRFVDANH